MKPEWVAVVVDAYGRIDVYGPYFRTEAVNKIVELGNASGGLIPQEMAEDDDYWNTEFGDAIALVHLQK